MSAATAELETIDPRLLTASEGGCGGGGSARDDEFPHSFDSFDTGKKRRMNRTKAVGRPAGGRVAAEERVQEYAAWPLAVTQVKWRRP